MQLLQNGTLVPTFFDLMGDKEDDMTAGLAYVLARSPIFFETIPEGSFSMQSRKHFSTNSGWASLLERDGEELERHYRKILDERASAKRAASPRCSGRYQRRYLRRLAGQKRKRKEENTNWQ